MLDSFCFVFDFFYILDIKLHEFIVNQHLQIVQGPGSSLGASDSM